MESTVELILLLYNFCVRGDFIGVLGQVWLCDHQSETYSLYIVSSASSCIQLSTAN